MAKPTTRIPLWARLGTKVDPGAAKESAGWQAVERPPAHWFNWILHTFGEWLSYFDSREVEDDGGTLSRLVWTVRDGNGDHHSLYAGDSGLTLAVNAEYQQGTGWVTAGGAAGAIYQFLVAAGDPSVEVYHGVAAGGSFPNFFDGMPIKAWGKVRTGAPGTRQILFNGSGLTGTPGPTGTGIAVDLSRAFSSTNAMCVIATAQAEGTCVSAAAATTSRILIDAYDIGTGLDIDLTSVQVDINVLVMGWL